MDNEQNRGRLDSILDLISLGGYRKVSLLLILIGFLTIHPQVQGYNDGSRMATIQGIVENGSFSIDGSDFTGGYDKVFINGKFYSDKPVFTALIGAAVYYPLYLVGIKLGLGWNLAYYLITLFTVKLFWYLGLKAFHAILRGMGVKDKERLLLTLALGIGSLYFTWSVTFSNHVLSAAFLIIGFYYWLGSENKDKLFQRMILAGFFISMAGVQDFTILAIYGAFVVVVLLRNFPVKAKIGFVSPLLLTILPTLGINYAISGSIVPFYLVGEYYEYPGNLLLRGNLFTGMQIKQGWELAGYSFHALIGSKGFLLHNPLSFLALPLIVEEIRKKGKLWREALAIGVSSLVVIIAYLVTSLDYGGFAYSIRWYVPLLPLWYIFLYRIFAAHRPGMQKAFSYLFVASVVIASVGIIDPWTTVVTGVPFLDNLITIVLGI